MGTLKTFKYYQQVPSSNKRYFKPLAKFTNKHKFSRLFDIERKLDTKAGIRFKIQNQDKHSLDYQWDPVYG